MSNIVTYILRKYNIVLNVFTIYYTKTRCVFVHRPYYQNRFELPISITKHLLFLLERFYYKNRLHYEHILIPN